MKLRHSFLLIVYLANVGEIFSSRVELGNRGLTSVPETISSSVDHLLLQGNQITSIRQSDFNDKYYNLNDLFLIRNKITSIEKGCFKGTILKLLYLNDNALTAFPDLREVSGTLTRIFIESNKITTISIEELSYLTKLEKLYLSNNLLSTLSDFTQYTPLLSVLNLEGNPLKCCNATIWWKQIRTGLSLEIDNFPCKYPFEWISTAWNDITEDMILRQHCYLKYRLKDPIPSELTYCNSTEISRSTGWRLNRHHCAGCLKNITTIELRSRRNGTHKKYPHVTRAQHVVSEEQKNKIKTNKIDIECMLAAFEPYCKYYYLIDRWNRPTRVSRGCIDAATCSEDDSYMTNKGYCGYLTRNARFCERCTLGTKPEHSGCLNVKTQYLTSSLFKEATDEECRNSWVKYADKQERKYSGCPMIQQDYGWSWDACARLACALGGNVINYVNKLCQVLKCAGLPANMRLTGHGTGYDVYALTRDFPCDKSNKRSLYCFTCNANSETACQKNGRMESCGSSNAACFIKETLTTGKFASVQGISKGCISRSDCSNKNYWTKQCVDSTSNRQACTRCYYGDSGSDSECREGAGFKCLKTYTQVAADTTKTKKTTCTLVEERRGLYRPDCINLACSKNINVVFHAGTICQLRSCDFDHEKAIFRNEGRSYWSFFMYDVGGNECTSGQAQCGIAATCQDVFGSYKCTCNKGFSGNPYLICTDKDECTRGEHNCDHNAQCINYHGGFTCQCNPGYEGDGRTCIAEKEAKCRPGSSADCGPNEYCRTAYIGGKVLNQCSCMVGYSRNSRNVCDDINECLAFTHNCDVNAYCINMAGTFKCKCKTGYLGDGRYCTVKKIEDDCLGDADCGVMASCMWDKLSKGYKCQCASGYARTGSGPCEDIDECATIHQGNKLCAENAKCHNFPGYFWCYCDLRGFKGDGYHTCEGMLITLMSG
ncbi:hypothetical protein CAPTEDRAFT_197182 [Capitella teleta]|uniref:EGF-like domain-containing protein n=1 Tax=Capitella teleta TaxID=283909 RepID=R7UJJ0_CAPTE|nr:hypothetical protein CAPTEDRAFT_197182 [Capitella teleta]|eukprot:ELU03928.1 hypothetical protein CAPTEDRAFT_197182 [Capitella teleta]